MARFLIPIAFFALLHTDVFGERDESEPYVEIGSKVKIMNINDKRAIYCRGHKLEEELEWYTPAGVKVDRKSVDSTRINVESTHNEDGSLSLIIRKAQLNDSGIWTCKSGPYNATINILVGEKVVFAEQNATYEGEEGRSIKLDCIAKGEPAPIVQWYDVDNTPITDDTIKYVIKKKGDNYQLEIKKLTHSDASEYICKATQDALSYFTERHVFLAVKHKPVLFDMEKKIPLATTYSTQEVYAVMNETKNITCSAIANPPPLYKWSKRQKSFDEDPIPEEDNIFTSEDGTHSILMLRISSESVLGEYKCSVNNTRGYVSIVYHVILSNKPNPPSYANMVNSTTATILFNVTCEDCKLGQEQSETIDPNNLPIKAYDFQLVPVVYGYTVANWDEAMDFTLDIKGPDDNFFEVGPLPNSTKFHARIRTENSAGFSDWYYLESHPFTTDSAVHSVGSFVLIMYIFIFSYVCH